MPRVCFRVIHTTTIWVASHVKLSFTAQRSDDKVPVGQIFGMVNLHTRVPFEGRCCNIVVISNSEDRGIGVEAWQDGIANLRHF